jgi:hypothetical protein
MNRQKQLTHSRIALAIRPIAFFMTWNFQWKVAVVYVKASLGRQMVGMILKVIRIKEGTSADIAKRKFLYRSNLLLGSHSDHSCLTKNPGLSAGVR